MTVPAGGALYYTLTPTTRAQLLTQYAGGPDDAVTVINLDPAGARIYLSSSSNVGPATGVPVDPGTSFAWQNDGELYAIADPAGTANATVVVTGAGGDWQPSPVAIADAVIGSGLAADIAAQIAASALAADIAASTAAEMVASGLAAQIAVDTATQLLAGGVPNVYVEQLVGNFNIPNLGGATALIDVHGYASLLLRGGNPAVGSLGIEWFNQNGDQVGGDIFSINSTVVFARIPVRGYYVQISKQPGTGATGLALYGTNRPVADFDARSSPENGDSWTQGSQVLAAGTTYTLTQPASVAGVRLAGLCIASFQVNNAAVAGRFQLLTSDGRGINVAVTTEMVSAPGAGLYILKEVAVPAAGDYSFQFVCTTAGTAALNVHLMPA